MSRMWKLVLGVVAVAVAGAVTVPVQASDRAGEEAETETRGQLPAEEFAAAHLEYAIENRAILGFLADRAYVESCAVVWMMWVQISMVSR